MNVFFAQLTLSAQGMAKVKSQVNVIKPRALFADKAQSLFTNWCVHQELSQEHPQLQDLSLLCPTT